MLIVAWLVLLQSTETVGAKQKVSDVDTTSVTLRRGKDESRTRHRVSCKPPRSMYLSRDDLWSAVASPSGETLVKMTESQLMTLKRQVS